MSRSRPSAGDRGSCSAASLQPWEPRGGRPVRPYQVHPVGLPERAEVFELLEHALEVDDDDGSQDGLREKSLQLCGC